MELKEKLQHRVAFQPDGLLMREENEQHAISGVAIVTNKETVLWEGADCREVEVIDPSCLNADFMAGQDIKLNLLHERNASFARNNKGAGTLVLDTREDGLHFECPVPDCDLGKRARALIGNGTYTGCSFEFWAKDYTVSERMGADGKTEYVVRHTAFERIGAITIGMDPAYEQTSVNAREILEEQRAGDEKKKEEPEEQPAEPTEEQAPAEDQPTEEECKKKKEAEEARELTLRRTLREIQIDLAADLACMED